MQAVKDRYVNIYDYVEAKRIKQNVRIFSSLKALARYSHESEKIFPLRTAKQGGILRALLKRISSPDEGRK